jgi:hypothetical protein
MKTAMQELIEELEKRMKSYLSVDMALSASATAITLMEAKKLLEKEKEQIIDAMERTAMYVSAASLDKEIGKMNFEDFYNQTYNQNK